MTRPISRQRLPKPLTDDADPQLRAAIAAARAAGLTRFKVKKGRIEIEVDESDGKIDSDAGKNFLKAVGAA